MILRLRQLRLGILLSGGLLTPQAVRADIVTDWNSAAVDIIRTSAVDPFNASRDLAILQISIMDAVNGVNRQDPGFYVNGSAAAGSSIEAAAASAGLNVMTALFGNNATFNALYANQIAALGGPSTPVNNGANWGNSVANSIVNFRVADGSSAANPPFTGSNTQGKWRATPPAFQSQPLLPGWGNVAPFALNTGAQFRPNGPATLDSANYATDFTQVKLLGSAGSVTRTSDQTNIARFWNGSQDAVTTWNKTAQNFSAGLTLNQSAKVFAALDVSLADAGIASMDAKYTYASWRPVSAIRDEATRDGGGVALNDNPLITGDATWQALITTPASPEYVSHTNSMSGAAAATLASLLGNNHIFSVTSDTNGDGVADLTRNYTSFSNMSSEALLSGVYAGINFKTSNEDGNALGAVVGQFVTNNYFTPVPEPSSAFYVLVVGLFLIMKRRNRLGA